MTALDPIARSRPEPRLITRRGLIKGGAGLIGVGGLMLTSTGAYAAAQAARDLVITRLSPVTAQLAERAVSHNYRDNRSARRRTEHGYRPHSGGR
jgi:hypothetical protein